MIVLTVGVFGLCREVKRGDLGGHIADQLVRSSGSGAANYAEARGAERHNDFIHKLGIVRKELNECLVWLKIMEKVHFDGGESIDALKQECDELVRIISASRKIAEERRTQTWKKF